MRLRTTHTLVTGAALLASCELQPCPAGWSPDRKLDLCVQRVDVPPLPGEVKENDDPTGDQGAGDAEALPDADPAGMDAGPEPYDAQAIDPSTPDAEPVQPVDAAVDSEASIVDADATTPGTDADTEAGTVADASCESAELNKWRNFQVSPAMLEATEACGGSLSTCASRSCEIARCMRQQAGVVDCADCIDAEARCVATYCAADCGSDGNASACLGCACFSRCFVASGTCGMGASDICATCNQGTCGTWWAAEGGTWLPPRPVQTQNRGDLQPVAFSRARYSMETLYINEDGTLSSIENGTSPNMGLGGIERNLGAPDGALLAIGSLAVAAWHAETVHVIARSTDGRLWLRTLRGGDWSEWQNPLEISGLRADDRLSIAARGAILRDAVFASSDGQIHHLHWDARGQASLRPLGAPNGVLLRSPMLVARDIEHLDMVALGNDRRVYHAAMRADVWSDWLNPHEITTDAAPQIVSPLPTSFDLFWYEAQAAGGDAPIKRMFWKEGSWYPPVNSTWLPVADWLRDVPSARSFVFDRIDLMGRFGASELFYAGIDRNAWVWTTNLSPGATVSYPVSLVSWGIGHLTAVYGGGLGTLGAITLQR